MPEACGILEGGSCDHGLNVHAHVCTFVQMWVWLTCFTGPGLHRTWSCLNMCVRQKPGVVLTVEIATTAHGVCPCPYICTDIGVAQVFAGPSPVHAQAAFNIAIIGLTGGLVVLRMSWIPHRPWRPTPGNSKHLCDACGAPANFFRTSTYFMPNPFKPSQKNSKNHKCCCTIP